MAVQNSIFMKWISPILLISSLFAYESATGCDKAYRRACHLAATHPAYFQTFRSQVDYVNAVELGPDGAFALYLLQHAYASTLEKLEEFRKLDAIGGPITFDFPKIGPFSGTTLRYILIADQIEGLFSLPENPKIAEIGAGFGGQCYILSKLLPFSRYWIYDLPETEALIEKVIEELQVENVTCLPVDAPFPEDSIDLVISNYAFSECDREMQMEYFDKVIKKAARGYLLYNSVGLGNSLGMSAKELVQLLKEHGMNPIIYPEPICTYEGNVLIVWD